ncbi:hypothetical protein [Marinobacter sp. VGCF2001]|uniref:hypothetical protein n=1 Tax=Marinobacter sp. VGCF2001 TaxID=3417189 RepID=UPI003CEE3BC5
MKVTELPELWEKEKQAQERSHEYNLRLPLEDAARIAALAELYPDRSESDILNDMVAAALDDLVGQGSLKERLAAQKKT